ncbi:hypothetical protein OESDEN_00407 [Oesophagostomum dentatum]|uniref:Uncharacterized protein n=1 Tax=Oesophagostomum dentatum TaxID=61180 RepID=A0A0B1TPW5_OESDE|nr:hypothetical protein OESDEN_00407 [Oesophagostomum dentatum]
MILYEIFQIFADIDNLKCSRRQVHAALDTETARAPERVNQRFAEKKGEVS